MNKKTQIFIGVIFILLAIGCAIFFTQTNNKEEKEDNEKIVAVKDATKYEILDSNVALEKPVKEWLDKNLKKEGFYKHTTKKETYVLLSGGEQSTSGFGISLNAVVETKNKVSIDYEVLSPDKNAKVENKESNPHMLVRFATTKKEIKHEKVTPEVEKAPTPTKEVKGEHAVPQSEQEKNKDTKPTQKEDSKSTESDPDTKNTET